VSGWKRLIYSLIPLLVLVGAGEGGLRMAGWPQKDSSRSFTHNEVYPLVDPSLRLQAFPHKETGSSFRVSTDANSLRAPLHPEEKPEGAFRIMTLGCSTTFGWGVDDEQTYPARLEAILKEQGHSVEVINAGQPGYTSFQGLWLWDHSLNRYHPDLVIFGYVVQDARKVAYSDRSQAVLQQNAEFLKEHFLYNSRLYLFFMNTYKGWRIASKDKEAQVYRVPGDEYSENIRSFQAKTKENGAKMMLFGYPLEREGYTKEHRGILHAAAEVLDLPIYDPQPEFEQLTSQQTLYFPQDRGHANAEGNAEIAKGMAQYLVANKIVP